MIGENGRGHQRKGRNQGDRIYGLDQMVGQLEVGFLVCLLPVGEVFT